MNPVLNGTDYMPAKGVIVKLLEMFQEAKTPLFFCNKIRMVFGCFPSPEASGLGIISLTHKVNC
jgi:hypothetical protein